MGSPLLDETRAILITCMILYMLLLRNVVPAQGLSREARNAEECPP